MHERPDSKKTLILTTLIRMLEQPHANRITTAALAQQLNQSEAALYRHFSNKANLFESLIDLAKGQLLEDLNHIRATEPDGGQQLRKQLYALLLFTERHPGLARVLTGEALIMEHPRLQTLVNALIGDIEAILQHAAQIAINTNTLNESANAATYANMLMLWVQGRWLRYTQTGWQAQPTSGYMQQLALLGLSNSGRHDG